MSDALRAETVTIKGHGVVVFEVYFAWLLGPEPRGGVVVIHHMPGYDEATKEMVRKFAAHGYAVLCLILYSREAPGADPDDAAATVRAAGGVPDERLVGDGDGAARYLKALDGANGKIGVIGHCSGGRQTFLAAGSLQVDAAVDCYGAFVVNEPPSGMPASMTPILGLAPQLSCPLLGLFGAEDGFPAPEAADPCAPTRRRRSRSTAAVRRGRAGSASARRPSTSTIRSTCSRTTRSTSTSSPRRRGRRPGWRTS